MLRRIAFLIFFLGTVGIPTSYAVDGSVTLPGAGRGGLVSLPDGYSLNGPTASEPASKSTNVSPVAVAGKNQNVHLGGTVTLDGSGSHDADGDELTYHWWFVSRPEGSHARIAEPNKRGTSFVADASGGYKVALTVSDGRLQGRPELLTVTAVSSRSDLVLNLVYVMDLINYADPSCFKSSDMQNSLTGDINVALEKIEQDAYRNALDNLSDNILARVDGCGGRTEGSVDADDWINCEIQAEIFPYLHRAMTALEDLLP